MQRRWNAFSDPIDEITPTWGVVCDNLKIVQQSIDLQILSAKERYETLLQKNPEIFQKVQLYHIANYLGIAPKSLSRIRKEIFDK